MPKGFVNADQANAEYLLDWKDDPWYPALVRCDERLTEIMPEYRITQIKEKFNQVRFYFDVPEEYYVYPWGMFEAVDKLTAECHLIDDGIAYDPKLGVYVTGDYDGQLD